MNLFQEGMFLTIIAILCYGSKSLALTYTATPRNHTTVPDDIPLGVTHLYIRQNYLTRLENATFSKFSQLIEADFWVNQITYVSPSAFEGKYGLLILKY